MNEFEKVQSAKILACYGEIEKGRKAEVIGSEKVWGGKKYVKTNNGWIPKKDTHIDSNKDYMELHKKMHPKMENAVGQSREFREYGEELQTGQRVVIHPNHSSVELRGMVVQSFGENGVKVLVDGETIPVVYGRADVVSDAKEDVGEKVSLQDLQNILNTMNQYNRQSGYMAFDNGGKFRFFDSMPSFGGAYVTKEDVEGYIKDYNKTDNNVSNHTEAINSLVEYAKKIGYDPEKQSLDTLMEKWNEENEKIYNFLKENKDKVKEIVGGNNNDMEIHSVNLMSKNNKENGFYLYNVIFKIGDKYFRSKSIKSDRILSKKDINTKDLEIQSEIDEKYYDANNIK